MVISLSWEWRIILLWLVIGIEKNEIYVAWMMMMMMLCLLIFYDACRCVDAARQLIDITIALAVCNSVRQVGVTSPTRPIRSSSLLPWSLDESICYGRACLILQLCFAFSINSSHEEKGAITDVSAELLLYLDQVRHAHISYDFGRQTSNATLNQFRKVENGLQLLLPP